MDEQQPAESKVFWDESMLTKEFDSQLKLVGKSLNNKSADTVRSPGVTTTGGKRPPEKKNVFSHKSRKFRLDEQPPCIAPPPFDMASVPKDEDEAQASMLMSWYMAGYHTGYFEAMKKKK